MAKSKYDRNIDKGVAQQRNPGQGGAGGRSGATEEETMGGGQQSGGGSKRQGGSPKRGHGQSGGTQGRNRSGGDNG